MYGDVVTTGQCCGINGCQRVTIEHKAGGLMGCSTELWNDKELAVACPLQNGDVTASIELGNPNVGVSVALQNDKAAKIGISLVCQTSVGSWEYLFVEEGRLFLIDGQAVIVKKKRT